MDDDETRFHEPEMTLLFETSTVSLTVFELGKAGNLGTAGNLDERCLVNDILCSALLTDGAREKSQGHKHKTY